MKFTELYSRIISKEAYNDMAVFFESHESFEEIPLVSRYSRLKLLRDEMNDSGVSGFLIGLAVFLLNTLRWLETSRTEGVFFAVTFTDFSGLEEQGVLMPNIFIYPKSASVGFLEKVREQDKGFASREITEVKRHFSSCGLETAFDFYESRFYDTACAGDIVRIFAISRTC